MGEKQLQMTFGDGSSNPNRMNVRAELTTSGWTSLCETDQLSTGTWYHIVVTYNTSTGWKLYQNGTLKDSNSNIETIKTPGTLNTNYIGWVDSGTNRHWDGLIDEIAVWDKELSSSEVTELYNSGDGLQYPFTSDVDDSSFFTLSLGAEF